MVGVRRRERLLPVCLTLGAVAFPACAPEPDGAAVFEQHCATCHREPLWPRAPNLEMMAGWSPELIVLALESGVMEEQGRELSSTERTAVADYIGGDQDRVHP